MQVNDLRGVGHQTLLNVSFPTGDLDHHRTAHTISWTNSTQHPKRYFGLPQPFFSRIHSGTGRTDSRTDGQMVRGTRPVNTGRLYDISDNTATRPNIIIY